MKTLYITRSFWSGLKSWFVFDEEGYHKKDFVGYTKQEAKRRAKRAFGITKNVRWIEE